jgi:hypothetical protein
LAFGAAFMTDQYRTGTAAGQTRRAASAKPKRDDT